MWNYTDKVNDHFLNPRNVGVVEHADGDGMVGSPACGDALRITFKLGADKKTIIDCKFQTYGCASAIAAASILTEMVKGKSLEEAARITNDDIVRELGGLPIEKIHCSVMGQEALQAAIENHRTGRPATPKHSEGRLVCHCFGVTEPDLEQAIRSQGLKTLAEVMHATKAGTACGKCKDDLAAVLQKVLASMAPPSGEQTGRMTNIEKIDRIKDVIARVIRPALQQDGGDIELVDVDGNDVKVRLTGHCGTCPMATMTLRNFVETQIQHGVMRALRVEQV